MRRRLLLALWVLAGALVALYGVRSFVADVYHVESGSMEPCLRGGPTWGEWLLVRYGRPRELCRFDLVVSYEDGGRPLVKRVAGLPGETVQVRGGDLFVDGKRLAPQEARPGPVVLFDQALHSVAEAFEHDGAVWTEDGDRWRLAAPAERRDEHLLRWRPHFDDGYLLPDGTRLAGTRRVGDGLVECEVEVRSWSAGGALRLELREEGDLFRAVLAADGEGALTARIERERGDAPVEVLAEAALAPLAGPTRLSFANVDNSLVLRVGASGALVAAYAENRPPPGPPGVPGATVGTQVALGGDGVEASFRGLRVARDVHWLARGDHGVDRPLSLGPGEHFLLGDNSADSLDSRSTGPARYETFLGVPVSVVWPRSRARRLTGASWVLAGPAVVARGEAGSADPDREPAGGARD